MELTIRLETEGDRREVEALTRDAFWNDGYAERDGLGCNEHYLAHILRDAPEFIPELDFIAEADGRLVGNVMYTRSRVETARGGVETVTFGPLSVLPAFQRQGVGSALVRHSLREAARLGYGAAVIFGHPDYYPRFGFREAAEFGVMTHEGESFPAFMAMELRPGGLDGAAGRFWAAPCYDVDNAAAAEFDRRFPKK